MKIGRLELVNFKNYREEQVQLHPKFSCFSGRNGAGKTNLLEAVHALCMTRTFHKTKDDDLIREGEDFYRLVGSFEDEEGEESEVVVKYPRGGRKQVELDGQRRKRMSDHIGRFPVVMIAPGEEQQLLAASAERRRWMDQSLGQMDRHYLDALMQYNRLLRQRNACLKSEMSTSRKEGLLPVYDEKMVKPAAYVQESRQALIERVESRFRHYYSMLSDGRESPSLGYEPDLPSGDHATQWELDRNKDLASGRTGSGIHRDDMLIELDERDVRVYASQGQRKSILLALRCAQYDWLYDHLRSRPILLLDDIFDKLDPERVLQLVRLIDAEPFGQVLITDTEPRRIDRIFKKENITYLHYLVEEGRLSEL